MDDQKIIKLLEEIKSGKQSQIYQLILMVLTAVKDKTDSQIANIMEQWRLQIEKAQIEIDAATEKWQAKVHRLEKYQARVVTAAFDGMNVMEKQEVSPQALFFQLRQLTEICINSAEDVQINYEKPKPTKKKEETRLDKEWY